MKVHGSLRVKRIRRKMVWCWVLLVVTAALLLTGCTEKRIDFYRSGRESGSQAEIAGTPDWSLEADRYERRGDYSGALRVVARAWLQQRDETAVARFTLLLSYLDERLLDQWWHQEEDGVLHCRIATEYFSRLQGSEKEALNPERQRLLLELAAALRDCSSLDPQLRRQAQEVYATLKEPSEKELVIGCLLPLSGDYAAAGRRFLRGLELAVQVFPALVSAPGLETELGNGVSGSGNSVSRLQVRLLLYDTAGRADRARAGVDYLVRKQKVRLLVGPYTVTACAAAAAEVEKLGVVMIALSPGFSEAGRYSRVFLLYPTIANQARSLARLARLDLGLESFALLVPRKRYGHEFALAFAGCIGVWGGKIVRWVNYDPDVPDFGSALRSLIGPERYRQYQQQRKEYTEWFKDKQRREKAAAARRAGDPETERKGGESLQCLARELGIPKEDLPPDFMARPLLDCDFEAVVIPDLASNLKLLLPQLAAFDLDEVFLLGGRYWNDPGLYAEVGDFLDGSLYVDAYARCLGISPELDHFQSLFTQLWPEDEPGLLDVLGFDAVELLRRLYYTLRVGNAAADSVLSAADWQAALRSCRDLPLAAGHITTQADGELHFDLYPLICHDGRSELFGMRCY